MRPPSASHHHPFIWLSPSSSPLNLPSPSPDPSFHFTPRKTSPSPRQSPLPPIASSQPKFDSFPHPPPPPDALFRKHPAATAARVPPVSRHPLNSIGFPSAAIVGTTAACVVLFAAGLIFLWSLRRRARRHHRYQDHDDRLSKAGIAPGNSNRRSMPACGTLAFSPALSWPWRHMFDYGELLAATGGFTSRNLIGEGGFGVVYRGRLPDGKEVAVKRLKKTGSEQVERQFRSEVEIISRVHHRNLVSLLGYCISKEQRLLVYEFFPNGTIERHLHGVENVGQLKWKERMKIAVGAARGLAYLHQDCHPQIIHCDVKSSNILLDEDLNAKVSDFGLAKLMSDPYGHMTTHVVGTLGLSIGYLAPDYPLTGKLTDKSDVYSFGVLLLEMVTGKKPIDTAHDSDYGNLIEWGQPLLERVLEEKDVTLILDQRLEHTLCNTDEVMRVLEVTSCCLNPSAKGRPNMSQVVRMLEKEERSCLKHPQHIDGGYETQEEVESPNHFAFATVFRMMSRAGNHHLIDHASACSFDFHTSTCFSTPNAIQQVTP